VPAGRTALEERHEEQRVDCHAPQLGRSPGQLGRSTALAGVFRHLLETDLLGSAKIRPGRCRSTGSRAGNCHHCPAIGSFKGWLLQITRWRIADQFRKRQPDAAARRLSSPDDPLTATIERVPDSRIVDLDALWEADWKDNLLEAAIARVKKKVDPKQFQIFDCYVRKEWPAQKVAQRLRVSVGQVYLARHRVAALLKKEIKTLEKIDR